MKLWLTLGYWLITYAMRMAGGLAHELSYGSRDAALGERFAVAGGLPAEDGAGFGIVVTRAVAARIPVAIARHAAVWMLDRMLRRFFDEVGGIKFPDRRRLGTQARPALARHDLHIIA